jgi:uncharacterized protein
MRRPDRLDIAAFAAGGEALAGQWSRVELPRFDAAVLRDADAAATPPIDWQARGEERRTRAGPTQPWVHVAGRTRGHLVCQRCLEPVQVDLVIDRWFRFAADADEAERLDAELDDDVLVTSTSFDLRALVEDELLLSLPLVPRHEVCPVTLDPHLMPTSHDRPDGEPGFTSPADAVDDPRDELVRRSPFADLATEWNDAQTQRRKKPGTIDH